MAANPTKYALGRYEDVKVVRMQGWDAEKEWRVVVDLGSQVHDAELLVTTLEEVVGPGNVQKCRLHLECLVENKSDLIFKMDFSEEGLKDRGRLHQAEKLAFKRGETIIDRFCKDTTGMSLWEICDSAKRARLGDSLNVGEVKDKLEQLFDELNRRQAFTGRKRVVTTSFDLHDNLYDYRSDYIQDYIEEYETFNPIKGDRYRYNRGYEPTPQERRPVSPMTPEQIVRANELAAQIAAEEQRAREEALVAKRAADRAALEAMATSIAETTAYESSPMFGAF